MDSQFPYVYGAVEECNSSESGWTMYIGSPGKSKEEDVSYNYKGEFDDTDDDDDDNHSTKHDDNSDDSMASDASSGPSHHPKMPWEARRAGNCKKYGAKVLQNRPISCHRAQHPAKNGCKKENGEEYEVEEVDNGKGLAKVVGHGANNNKVRKNHGFGKRK